MLRYFMTFHTFNTINIKPLYMLLLPAQVRRSPQTSTVPRPRHTSPRVTNKGSNYLDNPRAQVTTIRGLLARSLSTSRSVPYNSPPDQTNAYLYLNMRVSIHYTTPPPPPPPLAQRATQKGATEHYLSG